METKICSYTEKGVRLQLLRVDDDIELRLNRKCINVWHGHVHNTRPPRFAFISAVHQLLIQRSFDMSYLT